MTARARDVFAALIDAVVAPAPPLPPVTRDGAPAALDRMLAAAPAANRAGIVVALLALDAAPLPGRRRRFRTLAGEERRALLAGFERTRLRPLVQALRALAHLAYYGEDAAARAVGYDADAVLARAATARVAAAPPPAGARALNGDSAPPSGGESPFSIQRGVEMPSDRGRRGR